MPSGVLHFAVAAGDEPMVDLSVFNPRRDDYYAIDEACSPPMPDWRERIRRGGPAAPGAARQGPGGRAPDRDVREVARPGLPAEALAIAGYDFIVADMEHSPLSVAGRGGDRQGLRLLTTCR